MSGIDMAIEDLKTELNNIKLKISECRKKGFDTKIAELKVMNIPSKIKLLEATSNYREIERVNMMLDSVKEELNEIDMLGDASLNENSSKELKEYRAFLAKKESGKVYENYSQSEIMKTTEKLINEAHNNLDNGDYHKALHSYLDMRDIYKYLPKELKKPVYEQVIIIYKKILNSGVIKIKVKEEVAGTENKINIFRRIFGFILRSNKS